MITRTRRATLRGRLERLALLAVTLAALLALASPARARQIFFDYGDHSSAEDALEFSDIHLSRVVYSELGCPSRPVWLKLGAAQGETLRVQLGMPEMDALRRERPSLALLGPGLPRPAGLPFAAPAGLGARIFATRSARAAEVVREPVTGARSWLLLDQRIEVPETGSYHLVAWSPEARRARLWIAIGEEPTEELSNVDDPVERAVAFHQPWTAPDLSAPCAPARRPAPARPGDGARAAACAHAAGPAQGALPGLAAAALAAAAARRARRRGTPGR
ncbi:hypothetical protein [Sorangium sp. So ce1078]|uniref:hypothetical protein n=1 Tax=Sorangium sp. So ce1078 TaxID=3133329 RepID=UPI003F616369